MSFLELYLDFCVFVFGAAIGSFLNVCIHRMPRDESLVQPPSHCPHCGQRIRWVDNIPLVSYLALRGRCRQCQARITPRYFLVELLTAGLFLWVHVRFEGWLVPVYWVLVAGLIAATFIDFEHFIIPNEITYGGVVAGLALSTAFPEVMGTASHLRALGQSFLGALCGAGIVLTMVEAGKLIFGRRKVPLEPGTTVRIADQTLMLPDEELHWADVFFRDSDRIRFQATTIRVGERAWENATVVVSEDAIEVNGERIELAACGPIEAVTDLVIIPREAMGMGDVKFMGAIGAFLGWQATLFTLITSSLIGGILGLVLVLTGHKEWQSRIPYGPYLTLGALLWLLGGVEIVNWYFNLLLS